MKKILPYVLAFFAALAAATLALEMLYIQAAKKGE